MVDSTQSSKLLLVAAASAAASSLLTYAVFRMNRGGGSGSCIQAADIPGAARDPHDPSPRVGYLNWDDYFMAVAFLSAQRSKDPNKQVGACIVDQNNVICGIGYNGFPRGCSDSELPWAKKSARGDPLDTKYPYVCHAEMNAILNKNGASVAGARVFVTMFPCNECAKLMIQAGISEVVYHEDKQQPVPRSDSPLISGGFNRDQQYAASRRLLALAGVKLRQHLFKRPFTLCLTNGPPAHPQSGGSQAAAAAAASSSSQPNTPEMAPALAVVLQNGQQEAAAGAAAAALAAAAGAQEKQQEEKDQMKGAARGRKGASAAANAAAASKAAGSGKGGAAAAAAAAATAAAAVANIGVAREAAAWEAAAVAAGEAAEAGQKGRRRRRQLSKGRRGKASQEQQAQPDNQEHTGQGQQTNPQQQQQQRQQTTTQQQRPNKRQQGAQQPALPLPLPVPLSPRSQARIDPVAIMQAAVAGNA